MHHDRPLSYGEGRTMNSPDFEIYHFFDSRSCNIRLHHHDFFELYYLRAGQMDYIVDGRHYSLYPGTLLFITPDQLHRPQITNIDDFERFVLWINPAFMAHAQEFLPGISGSLLSGTRISSFITPDDTQREAIEVLLFALRRESQEQLKHRTVMCHTLLLQLLIHIKRILMQLPQADSPSFAAHAIPAAGPALPSVDVSSEHLRDVFSYIQDHLSEDLSLSALAERFFFNPNTLARRFKLHAGIPLGEYVRKKRLAAARLLIYQGKNAIQVGTAVGFTDYSTFYRAFRQEYGVSPKDFARSCRTHP